MEQIESSNPNLNTLVLVSRFLATLMLTWFGFVVEDINIVMTKYTHVVEFTKALIQCFAWLGAGFTAIVVVVTWLQNNGIIRKGKPKK